MIYKILDHISLKKEKKYYVIFCLHRGLHKQKCQLRDIETIISYKNKNDFKNDFCKVDYLIIN